MKVPRTHRYHVIAILTVIVWGTTFVSTKILIGRGLSPLEILFYRFLLAYAAIWIVSPRILFARKAKDELLCVAAGLCGGSLYFYFENTALTITLASNVSLIVCTAPIFTAFLGHLFFRRERIRLPLIAGSLIALVGVAMVVFNGSFILKIKPLGDILSVLAALSWAFYSVILRRLSSSYPILFITRKVFFYGIITVLPFVFSGSDRPNISLLADRVVIANLVFLGLVASMLCYIAWNTTVKKLGVITTSKYIYLTPPVTLLTSAIVIHEKITIVAIVGCALILSGVYIADRRRFR